MATATHLSLEEFHRLYDGVKPNHEYWYGEAFPKPMPTLLHSITQVALIMLLARRGWKALPEVTLKMSSDAEPVPDIIATRRLLTDPYPTQPVEICIEILSPDDRLKKALEKGKRYIDWGVGCVWIVNPVERSAWVLTRETPEGVWIRPDGALPAGEDTEIPLTELFSEVDKLL